jgi:DNA-binding transcriptional MerR regulator
MLNIGEFARLGQVSPRMLRHYDQLGLLRPERVDAETGYRSYGVHQLVRLHRLLALRPGVHA